jgi:hypothetical protein
VGSGITSKKGVNRVANAENECEAIICPSSAVSCVGENPGG